MKKVLVAITGGISAYKALDVISGLKASGFEVKAIATGAAFKFITKEAIGAISGNYVEEDNVNKITHIELAKWCDLFLLVPATANSIAKITCGIADNLVTSTYLALPGDTLKVICPAMNVFMYTDGSTIENITKLIERDVNIIEPVSGLLACGDYGPGKLPKPRKIVEGVIDILNPDKLWMWPLSSCPINVTLDSYSFLDLDSYSSKCEIPIYPHVGSFGIRRRNDIHKGIDLYADNGAPVKAVEKGTVVDICPFTGPDAGFPWWNNTQGVYVEGKDHIVVYGEINPNKYLKIGSKINKGQNIGTVATVIKKDKGRPMSMLHLELHKLGHIHCGQWELNQEKPEGILDPTAFLIRSFKHYF